MPINPLNEKMITDEEVDILQEIMNIAFGKAASDLAEVIDIHVALSVPYIKILKAPELPVYIKDEIRDLLNISIIEQKFLGKFKGTAFMVFPSYAAKELIGMLGLEKDRSLESDPVETLEREVLMEVGNILIGACIGKISELLKDIITYSPPHIILHNQPTETVPENHLTSNDSAIVLKTVFGFEKGEVGGFLFLVTSQDSIQWLKGALQKFMEQYE